CVLASGACANSGSSTAAVGRTTDTSTVTKRTLRSWWLLGISKLELQVAERRKQHSAVIDLLETSARRQHRHACAEHRVLAQQRPVTQPNAVIAADGRRDRPLKQQQLQRLGVMKAHEVRRGKALQLRRQIKIRAHAAQQDAG